MTGAGAEAAQPADDRDWRSLREAARVARELGPSDGRSFAVTAAGTLVVEPAEHSLVAQGTPDDAALGPDHGPALARLAWRSGRWVVTGGTATPLIDLYLPVCSASRHSPITVGHLGQSLDGYVATASGDSDFVTGPENIVHLHRMRALADAVIVGAGTARSDDPRLTVRRVEGENPVRVVLDPRRRLPETLSVFSDGLAPTLLVVEQGIPGGTRHGRAEVLEVSGLPPEKDLRAGGSAARGRLDLRKLTSALHARGLFSLFVEGGGNTVSGFLEAGLLDRLQVAVAPMLIGEGRPGLRLGPRDAIAECLRPEHRVFAMGEDVLFDCDLRAGAGSSTDPLSPSVGLRRIG